MDKTNEKKKRQLGMPLGTASGRLKKIIMLDLLRQLDLNYCFQCGAEICTEKELSIEHKIPYLDSEDPISLFFDLKNIAFSHLSCNTGAARPRNIIHPSDTAYKKGCRCEECKNIHKERWNKYKQKRVTEKKKKLIIPLIEKGYSYRQIEKDLGIGRQSITRYLQKIK
jgi:hypothetical protein